MTKPVVVKTKDNKTELSREAWDAWTGTGVEVPAELGSGGGGVFNLTSSDDEPDGGVPDPGTPANDDEPAPEEHALSVAAVENMLGNDDPWRLVVSDGTTFGILERGDLQMAANSSAEHPVVTLEALQGEEARIYTQALGEIDNAPKALKEAKALPVASVGLLSAVGGGFGYAAAKDDLARPGMMLAGAIVGVAAICLSLLMTALVKTEQLPPGRLDLLVTRWNDRTRRGARNARIATVLLLISIVLIGGAIIPTKDEPSSASATIGKPHTRADGRGGYRSEITVTWKDLGDTISKVQSTATLDGRRVGFASDFVEGKTAEQTLVARVPAAGTVDVTTKALDKDGKEVGQGAAKSFDVP